MYVEIVPKSRNLTTNGTEQRHTRIEIIPSLCFTRGTRISAFSWPLLAARRKPSNSILSLINTTAVYFRFSKGTRRTEECVYGVYEKVPWKTREDVFTIESRRSLYVSGTRYCER